MADYATEQNLRLAQQMLKQQGEINALRAERDTLKAAIEKLSARHQPKVVPGVRNCGQHSARGVCTDCETYEALVCSNLTCCEYPCDDRRAIDAALAVPESNEDAASETDEPLADWEIELLESATDATPDAPTDGED